MRRGHCHDQEKIGQFWADAMGLVDDGTGFVHKNDIEGNDFCVVRSKAERS